MVTLNSLNTIIDDILLEMRNNNISESENMSRIQIEQWITQYRAMLIKQDIDKGRDLNPDYIQSIENIHLSQVDFSSSNTLPTNKIRYKSDIEIPNTLDFHFKSGIINITDLFGNEIQQSNKIRAGMQKDRRWTKNEYLAYKIGKNIYLEGPGELEYINIYLITENPRDIESCMDADAPYPIPVNMLPTLKELIFTKELKINAPTDRRNDSTQELENIQVGQRAS